MQNNSFTLYIIFYDKISRKRSAEKVRGGPIYDAEH